MTDATALAAQADVLMAAWKEIVECSKRPGMADASAGLILAASMIERRRQRIGVEYANTPETVQPVVSIKPMELSGGRTDYFVSIKVGDREVTPHAFNAEFKAAYHVALYDWLLNGTGEEPSVIEFGPNDWPARAVTKIDVTNHHNALLCPYCNPRGLKGTSGLTVAMEIVGNMRQSEAGLFDAQHSGQRGEDRSNALYDAYQAIRAALSPPQDPRNLPKPKFDGHEDDHG